MKNKDQIASYLAGLKLGYQENELEFEKNPEQFDMESFFSLQDANLEKIKVLEWILE